MEDWIGIDFGSQNAGTTVIVGCRGNKLELDQSVKGASADDFILSVIDQWKKVTRIFIDAPLSLPAAYFGCGDDFMYRAADREVSAMSPMFLGGLTARAMRIADRLRSSGRECFETYPARVESEILGYSTPKKKVFQTQPLKEIIEQIEVEFPLVENRHQYDAIWAWLAGYRHHKGIAKFIGNPKEGVIVI
jgi:predicted nuclease with RNAse H fold